jgi:hypothetical protein
MRRLVVLLALLTAAVAAPTASAVALPSVLGSCGDQPLARPFVRWLDPAQYTLAPNGDLESDGAWRLDGGARIVAGNESFSVGGASDRRSLALPAGSSATTGWMCVGLEHPTLRLFVRNNGPLLSTLRVDVMFRDVFGVVRALPVSVVANGRSWRPTLPIVYLANVPTWLLPLGGPSAVAFRFVPQSSGANWQIDDVYVDPFRGR